MTGDRPLSREELDDGIRRLSRQLELLRSGPTLGEPSDDAQVIADLEAELAALRRRVQDPS
jgi:hypothetical protein